MPDVSAQPLSLCEIFGGFPWVPGVRLGCWVKEKRSWDLRCYGNRDKEIGIFDVLFTAPVAEPG